MNLIKKRINELQTQLENSMDINNHHSNLKFAIKELKELEGKK